MHTWATQLHPYVLASHRHFQLAPEDAGRASSSGATWKKDMYQNAAYTIFAVTKGCWPWVSKMSMTSSSLYSDKQGCWGKGFCLAPFCGECIVLTCFFWNWSLGKKAKPLVSIVLANAQCAGDFRLACHWNLYWRRMYWTLLLEKHVLDTSIGEESIGRPYNLYWRQLCWTTFIEHGSDSGVPFKFPKKPHSKPKGLLSGEHVTHTLKLDIACWHLKFICCLPFVKRRTSSQAP